MLALPGRSLALAAIEAGLTNVARVDVVILRSGEAATKNLAF